MIEFVCPSCQSGLRVTADTAGKVVRCGSCLATVRVPDVPPEPPRNAKPVHPTADPIDRPLRRRRRLPPPQKTGRSALFWILLVLAVLAVIGLGVCGGLIVMLQPKWQTHESPEGGFKVELPGKPRTDMRELAKMQNDPDFKFQVEGTVLVFQGEGFGVMYTEIDPQLRRMWNDDRLMDEIVKGIRRDQGDVKIESTKPLTVSGFPARELVLSHPEEGKSVWRIVVADTRLYLVFAGGRNVIPENNERIRRFIDSFQITDPKLLAKAGQRGRPKPPEQKNEPVTDALDEATDNIADGALGAVK